MDKPVDIAFIGAGKVGCSLARYLACDGGVRLAGFFSRSAEHAREAAAFAGGVAFDSLGAAVAAADVVFVTTPDAAIAGVGRELARAGGGSLAGKIVAHCSGATPSSALDACRGVGACVASLHPLYAVSSRFDSWRELASCTFAVEGDECACDLLGSIVRELGAAVVKIDGTQKARYHAAAVMASNLVVGLYDMAVSELVTCGFDHAGAERALAPLFLGNARHVAEDGPANALTGPAARGDEATIERHLSCLGGDTRAVYELLTQRCREIAKRRG